MGRGVRVAARGTAVALAAVGVGELVAVRAGVDSPLDDAARLSVDLAPAPVVEHTVRLVGTSDKPVARSMVLATLATAGSLGVARGRGAALATLPVGAAAGVWLARRRPPPGPLPAQLAVAASGALAGAVALLLPLPAAAAVALGGLASVVGTHRHRQRVLLRAVATALAEPLPADAPLPPAVDGAEDWPGALPFHTPVPDLYVTDVNLRAPLLDRDTWRLAVDGLVERTLSLSDADLRALGVVELDAALVCVHSRPGWHRLGNVRLQGVPLERVLAAAGVRDSAVDLVSTAVDGFVMRHPLEVASGAEALIVLGMGGRRLTAEHGAPARLFVPGLYGQYAGVKWLERLTLTATRGSFYWQSRGWPAQVLLVRPMSRIDAVGGRRPPVGSDARSRRGVLDCPAGPAVAVVGTAWAPSTGVGRVQVRVDDGPWTEALLAAQLDARSWRRWRADVVLAPGRHRLAVRCATAAGQWQDPNRNDPYPTGATGLHTVQVEAHQAG